MKTELFCIQKNPTTALFPVRILRVTENSQNKDEGHLHPGYVSSDCPENLKLKISAFRAEFPKGKVQVETAAGEVKSFRESDLEWLFDHPSTFKSSL